MGYTYGMANLKTSEKINEAFSNCRDFTEKIDMLMFAVSALGDDRIGQEMLDWHALQTAIDVRPQDEQAKTERDEKAAALTKEIEKEHKQVEKETGEELQPA